MTERDRFVIAAASDAVSGLTRLPVNMEALCRSRGVRLLPASAFAEQGLPGERLFPLWGNRDGVVLRRERLHVICYNDAVPPARRRFTLAEELMHILLGHTLDADFSVFGQCWAEETYQRYEREAKHGAAMLLLPPPVYSRLRGSLTPERIGAVCGVSKSCARTAARRYEEHEQELRRLFTASPPPFEAEPAPWPPRPVRRALDVWPENSGML